MYVVYYFYIFFFSSDSRFPHGRVGVRGMRYTDQRRVVDGRLFREYRLSYTNVLYTTHRLFGRAQDRVDISLIEFDAFLCIV